MPIYEYLCEKCSSRFERLVRSRDAEVSCPGCSSRKVRRMVSAFGLNLGASPDAPQFQK
jgi:putative FmdB family regulatory protein